MEDFHEVREKEIDSIINESRLKVWWISLTRWFLREFSHWSINLTMRLGSFGWNESGRFDKTTIKRPRHSISEAHVKLNEITRAPQFGIKKNA